MRKLLVASLVIIIAAVEESSRGIKDVAELAVVAEIGSGIDRALRGLTGIDTHQLLGV